MLANLSVPQVCHEYNFYDRHDNVKAADCTASHAEVHIFRRTYPIMHHVLLILLVQLGIRDC